MTADECVDRGVVRELERMVGRDVVREIIDLFLEHAPLRLAKVREAGNVGNLDSVAKELHALKSSAGSIGALRLQRLAEEVEKLAAEGQVVAVRARLDELTAALDRVVGCLGEVRDEQSS